MSHKIDFSKGYAAFVAFQKPAWTGLGYVSQEELTIEQAAQKGGLDYDVLKLPNVHILPNGEEIISKSSFFTCRTDTNKVLGDRLGSDYKVLQNMQALDVVQEILMSGQAKIETAGVIEEGRRAFICLKVDKSLFVGDNDEIFQYAVIVTSHDGSTAISIFFTNVRVVCYNTLTSAINGAINAIKIRHTTNAAARLNEAAKVLRLIKENEPKLEDGFNAMKLHQISKEQMMNYFGNIFLDADEIKELREGKQAKDVISSQKQNTLAAVLDYSSKGLGQQLAYNGGLNMWFAYNAVTGYMTSKKYPDASNRMESLLYGSAQKKITEAGVLALAPEKIQTLSRVSSSNFGGMNFN